MQRAAAAIAFSWLAWACMGCGDDDVVADASVDAFDGADAGRDGGDEVDAGDDADLLPDAGDDSGFDGGFTRLEGDVTHPMDEMLTLNMLQAEGTHNSYHLRPTDIYPPGMIPSIFDYEFDPVDVQLEEQGVRAFEFDTYWDVTRERYNVLHVPSIDYQTSCETLVECLATVRTWSDAHPGHHPIFIQIETKSEFADGEVGLAQIDTLDAELDVVFGDLLITPAEVQGDAETLRDAVTSTGWPTLAQTRGRVLAFLNCGRSDCIRYANVEDRLAFADSNGDDAWSAVRILNTPGPNVEAAVRAGFIVRTRAFGHEAVLEGDEEVLRLGLEAAVESGAQIISTDLPAPIEGLTFFSQLDGGTPSICNELTSPEECTSEAIEDPSLLMPE